MENDLEIMTAKDFLLEISKLKLSGREFLALVGNSKINNDAFTELRDSKSLTQQRIIELFENSTLTSADYEKMLKAAYVYKKKQQEIPPRENQEKKLQSAITEANKRMETLRKKETVQFAKLRTQQIVKPKPETDNYTPNPVPEEVKPAEKLNLSNSTPFPKITPSMENKYAKAGLFTIPSKTVTEKDDNTGVPIDTIYSTNFLNSDEEFDQEIDEDFDREFDEKYEKDLRGGDENTNKGKLIACLILGFLLFASSFIVRYVQTGDFLPQKEIVFEEKAPETYEDIARLLYGLPTSDMQYNKLIGNYYIDTSIKNSIKPVTVTSNEKYIFYLNNGSVYAVKKASSEPTFIIKSSNNKSEITGIFLYSGYLYVLYNYSYEASFTSLKQLDTPEEYDEFGELIHNKISDAFIQSAVIVEVYNAEEVSDAPNTYTYDGVLHDIGEINGQIYITTEFSSFEPKYYDAVKAYMPSYSLNNNEYILSVENAIIAGDIKNKRFNLLGVLNPDNPEAYAVIGSEAVTSFTKDNKLYFIIKNSDKTEIIRFDESFNRTEYTLQGTAYESSVDEIDGIIRICTETETGFKLYIFDSEFNLLSLIENIAAGEQLKGVLFDELNVYMIASKLYAFETSVPNDPIISENISVNIYSDDFLYWSDKERLSLTVDTDESGNKKGLRVTMYKLQKGELVETASTLITAESTVAGNWNRYLETPVDNDKLIIDTSAERGMLVIPVRYFDGISEIDKFIVYEYNEHVGFTEVYQTVHFDLHSEMLCGVITENQIYTFIDTEADVISEIDYKLAVEKSLSLT